MKRGWIGRVVGTAAALACALWAPDAGAQTVIEGCHGVVVLAESGAGSRLSAPVAYAVAWSPKGGTAGTARVVVASVVAGEGLVCLPAAASAADKPVVKKPRPKPSGGTTTRGENVYIRGFAPTHPE